MSFESLQDFIAMGGHGPFVWTCYGVTILIIFYNIVQPIIRRKDVLKRLNRNLKRESNS
ncbi:MAG: heme exporter protein CcmD [Hahellaceae bacterium]|nr:heme exporter protein CcmD [Hahellaceae bacterium]MCP5212812.1 heme exporter protein CcmD [Hahellaceae bacterium]